MYIVRVIQEVLFPKLEIHDYLKIMSKSIRATIIATAFFLLYGILFFLSAPVKVLIGMLLVSPVVLGWLVYTVITDKNYNTRDLKDDEEFSYKDWPEASERRDEEK